MKKNILIIFIIGVLIIAGICFWQHKTASSYKAALAACNTYPNDSVQHVTETSRLTINLPKDLYPNQGNLLSFQTASGTATAGWISNAGPVGQSYGATGNCWAYYYDFEGQGEVDLIATSTIKNVPDYHVRFLLTPVFGGQTIEYKNDEYGFTFALPEDWKGYTTLDQTWTGYSMCSTGQCPTESGPEIIIRNPNWTAEKPWQDIPIMVFTPDQWSAVNQGTFTVSAAPIPPSELGRNDRYIFALPPRYNFAYSEGWEEVENILKTNPLKAN